MMKVKKHLPIYLKRLKNNKNVMYNKKLIFYIMETKNILHKNMAAEKIREYGKILLRMN
jgi:hypothetical protein